METELLSFLTFSLKHHSNTANLYVVKKHEAKCKVLQNKKSEALKVDVLVLC